MVVRPEEYAEVGGEAASRKLEKAQRPHCWRLGGLHAIQRETKFVAHLLCVARFAPL